jgi:hypothetical protein
VQRFYRSSRCYVVLRCGSICRALHWLNYQCCSLSPLLDACHVNLITSAACVQGVYIEAEHQQLRAARNLITSQLSKLMKARPDLPALQQDLPQLMVCTLTYIQ